MASLFLLIVLLFALLSIITSSLLPHCRRPQLYPKKHQMEKDTTSSVVASMVYSIFTIRTNKIPNRARYKGCGVFRFPVLVLLFFSPFFFYLIYILFLMQKLGWNLLKCSSFQFDFLNLFWTFELIFVILSIGQLTGSYLQESVFGR